MWLSIGKIVDEETVKLGINATPQFIGALTEMVWAQIGIALPPEKGGKNFRKKCTFADSINVIETASQDLESFAK